MSKYIRMKAPPRTYGYPYYGLLHARNPNSNPYPIPNPNTNTNPNPNPYSSPNPNPRWPLALAAALRLPRLQWRELGLGGHRCAPR